MLLVIGSMGYNRNLAVRVLWRSWPRKSAGRKQWGPQLEVTTCGCTSQDTLAHVGPWSCLKWPLVWEPLEKRWIHKKASIRKSREVLGWFWKEEGKLWYEGKTQPGFLTGRVIKIYLQHWSSLCSSPTFLLPTSRSFPDSSRNPCVFLSVSTGCWSRR